MNYRINERTKLFLKKAAEIHGDTYTYNNLDYKNSYKPARITCKKHGDFKQRPRSHIEGHGCPACALKSRTLTIDEIISRAHKAHQNKYDYKFTGAETYRDFIVVRCPLHGEFQQRITTHLQGRGCKQCSVNDRRLTHDEFVERANETHAGFYDYSYVQYKNIHTKVKVICPLHGIFEVSPTLHIQRTGCPRCRKSKMHRKVSNTLNNLDINYEEEKRFHDCRNKYPLPFDFYLPEQSTLIECDGEHHFRPVMFSNNIRDMEIAFQATRLHDKIKNKYAEENGYHLLRIPYNKMDIKGIIQNFLADFLV